MSVLLLNVLQVFFSLFGCVFALKDFGDPALSAWAAPGPGRLLGDGGRMLVFEVGDQGVLSKLLGAPAWLLEGLILGMGSIGMLSCWISTNAEAQLVAVLSGPIQAAWWLVGGAFYLPLFGMHDSGPILAILALPQIWISVARVRATQCASQRLLLHYLSYLLLVAVGLGLWIQYRAPEFAADIELHRRVEAHFASNGNRWSQEFAFPDGFKLNVERRKQWGSFQKRNHGWWDAWTLV